MRDIQWSRLCRRYGRQGDVSLSLDLQTFDRSFALVGFGSAFNELPCAIAWPLDGFIRTGGDASTVDGNIYGADGARAAGPVHRTDAVFAWAGNAASRLLARNMD